MTEAAQHKSHAKAWKLARRLLTLAFFILVPTLLYFQMKDLDWAELLSSLRGFPPTTLALCVLVAIASYITYASYDLLGRLYTRHSIPVLKVLTITFVCYVFTLNLSALVGGIALRYRLYSREGLSTGTTTRILSLSLVTNWGGYMLLAGTIFAFGLLHLPESWKIGDTGLQVVGVAMLLLGLAYLAACAFSKRRSWHLRGHEIELPPFWLALAQMGLGALNWALMGLLIYLLMPEDAFYPTILGILLISSVAGVITHIPGGLGVLEAVYIALLQHEFAKSEILAALIGYRAIYFLMPLAVAALTYLVLERRAAKNGGTERSSSEPVGRAEQQSS
ncbi:MAG: lysylphosphatidylglycerol synthase domain-containing protein [Halopseudomonas sp.]|uniref:lysylphosphatidylglycerol synthase domain-containing protein n=1 Tax=Halopseudomonas sp. TaxID=2901191 RepID=UPI00300259B2